MALSDAWRTTLDKTADPSQLADWMLLASEDGPSRGSRFLVGRTIAGLNFKIAVDRGFDIVDLDYNGIPLGWRGRSGFAAPALHAADSEDGLAFVRVLSGFLVTCGWDHFGPARTGPADHYAYGLRDRAHYPLHGRATFLPGTLLAKGIDWGAEGGPVLYAEAMLRQTAMFAETIEIRRRLAFGIGRPTVTLTDTVTNTGRKRTPHRVLYHINLGYPLIDDDCIVDGIPVDPSMPSPMPPLDPDGAELFRCVDRSSCKDTITLTQPNLRGGLSLAITMATPTFTHLVEWWNRYPGMNAIGIEPASASMPGLASDGPYTPDAWLDAGQTKVYRLEFALSQPA